ncbi:MAG TPA: ribbon-helix-helix protein, CopG family [Woeseiaceae bacterium]|nr:ribbon-helix-helix protein, CopG family [Woeseiaceae bacterium]
MSLVSIRLPKDVQTRLAQEAERVRRPKSEIAREAIVDYLARMERERFLGEIARAARSRGDEEVLSAADEALSLDNEALAIAEGSGVREPSASYHRRKKKKKKR